MPPLAPIENDDARPITRSQADRLIALTERLAETNTWRKVARVALGIGMAALLVLGVLNGLLFQRVASDSTCVRNWAVQTTVRTNLLLPLSTARTDALDTLIRSLDTKTPEARQQAFQTAFAAYLAASDDYRKALGDNPPPPAPAFNC